MRECPVITWDGCYSLSWQGLIVGEAFAHPAKYAHGLIRRIIEHGLERGWWTVGSYIGDPFGGVALGGIVAGYYGLNWVGVELEPRFVELGNRNIDLHRAKWKALGYDVDVRLVQGDSREFATILRRLAIIDQLEQAKGSPEQMAGIVTSPPFQQSGVIDHEGQTNALIGKFKGGGASFLENYDYGSTPGQIGRLKAGELSSVITSPPYAEGLGHGGEPTRNGGRGDDRNLDGMQTGYGSTPGQIGRLKAGQVDSVITSPPYADTHNQGGDQASHPGMKWANGERADRGKVNRANFNGTDYGDTPGQIGALRAGQIEACVTSPPYEGTGLSNACDPAKKRERLQRLVAEGKITGRESVRVAQRGWNTNTQVGGQDDYGESDGQIGNSTGQTYWEAVAQVYQQVYQSLRPGGVMAVVVKDYVAKGKRVPLCDDTLKLLVSIGFEPIERVHAMLVKETVENTLFDGPVVKRREKKSFFRRLTEKRGSPRIDFEEVLVVRKFGSQG